MVKLKAGEIPQPLVGQSGQARRLRHHAANRNAVQTRAADEAFDLLLSQVIEPIRCWELTLPENTVRIRQPQVGVRVSNIDQEEHVRS
jgi:hypothetical protein